MQVIKCPNCGCGEIKKITDEQYECLGCDNPFFIHNLSKEFRITDEHIAEMHKDLKETIEKSTSSLGNNAGDVFIKRALLQIEDEEFSKADEILEQALNIDPENAEIYATKLLIAYSVKSLDGLSGYVNKVINDSNFEKMLRFSKNSGQLTESIKALLYNNAVVQGQKQINDKNLIQESINIFQKLGEYKDSKQKFDELSRYYCELEKELKEKEDENDYSLALSIIQNQSATISDIEEALKTFQRLDSYKDSYLKVNECEKFLKNKKEKRNKLMSAIIGIAVLGCIIGVFINTVIAPPIFYKNAMVAESEGRLYDAYELYGKSGSYEDSREKAIKLWMEIENAYSLGRSAYLPHYSSNLDLAVKAYDIFSALGSYEESEKIVENLTNFLERNYLEGVKAFEEGDIVEAKRILSGLKGYKDSEDYYNKCVDCNYVGHTWNEYLCGSPCDLCGEKRKPNVECVPGKAATCDEGQYCSKCNTLLKEALGCDYSEATCTEPPTCKICGMQGGYALGHQWGETTCTEPTLCTRCGEIVLEAKGHEYTTNGILYDTCYICGIKYYCECIIDSSSENLLVPYDAVYNEGDEYYGQGYVVVNVDTEKKNTIWAKLYYFNEDNPEIKESSIYVETGDVLPLFHFTDRAESVVKVVYGIKSK